MRWDCGIFHPWHHVNNLKGSDLGRVLNVLRMLTCTKESKFSDCCTDASGGSLCENTNVLSCIQINTHGLCPRSHLLYVFGWVSSSISMMVSEMGLHVLGNCGLHLCILTALTWAFPVLFLDLECSPVSTSYMMPPVPRFHVSDLPLRLSRAYVYSLLLPLCGFLGLIFSVVVMSLVSSINRAILSVCPSCSPRKKFSTCHGQNTADICLQKHWALSPFVPTTQCKS